jgi:3-isopropylmalate dehydrogenase
MSFDMLPGGAQCYAETGETHGHSLLRADGARLRQAVERVIAEGRVRTVDMGGTATTDEAAAVVAEALG